MKILHIHNMMIRNKGVFKFYSGRKFSNGIIRNNHTLLEFSDRDLCRYNSTFHIRSIGKQRIQKQLIETVLNFRPDLIILGHCDLITNETLFEIRRLIPDIRIAHWFLDPLWINENIKKLDARKHACDSIFITTGGDTLKKFQAKDNIISYIPNPFDPAEDTLNNSIIDDFNVDLLFCGARNPDPRLELINSLITLFSTSELKLSVHGTNHKPNVWGEKYKDILKTTKMGLNLNAVEGWKYYSSDRIAQLIGNGILTFMWDKGSMKKLISSDHAVYFNSKEDLVEKIKYFHMNDTERKRVAAAGYNHYTEHFSAERIIQYIIETTFRIPLSYDYLWQEEKFKG